jgi:YfiH family protein
MSNSPRIITPSWDAPSNVVAYTSTRQNGVSEGEFAGCNVGNHVGDDPIAVKSNRANLPYADNINWLQQVHGDHIIDLPLEASRGCGQLDKHDSVSVPKADAAISSTSHVFCAVMTADCVPILLCDSSGTQVAAIHAGWKGLRLDIIAKCVKQFNAMPNQLMAWIGPAICQTCYEVDPKLANIFSHYAGALKAGTKENKFQLDLPKIAEFQLLSLGIEHVINSRRCTYCEPALFYSHRRATHQGLTSTGRMVSVIGLS